VDRLPPVTDFMAETSRQYLDEVLRLLRAFDIPVRLNTRLVRGLDYYVHTVWEITHNALGAQNALGGGGRYRIEMDGRPIEGVGFAMGIERLVAARPPAPAGAAVDGAPAVWLVARGAPALAHNLILAQTLRRRGVACGYEPAGGSMKSQMRAANKAGAPVVLICGDNELAKGLVIWKRMADGAQEELELPQVMERLVRPGP